MNLNREKISQVFAYLDGIEFFIGCLLNTLIIITCLQPNLRRTPNFLMTSIFAFCNIGLFTIHSFTNFLDYMLGLDLESESLAWCKISFYCDVSLYHWNAWLLVIILLNVIIDHLNFE